MYVLRERRRAYIHAPTHTSTNPSIHQRTCRAAYLNSPSRMLEALSSSTPNCATASVSVSPSASEGPSSRSQATCCVFACVWERELVGVSDHV